GGDRAVRGDATVAGGLAAARAGWHRARAPARRARGGRLESFSRGQPAWARAEHAAVPDGEVRTGPRARVGVAGAPYTGRDGRRRARYGVGGGRGARGGRVATPDGPARGRCRVRAQRSTARCSPPRS